MRTLSAAILLVTLGVVWSVARPAASQQTVIAVPVMRDDPMKPVTVPAGTKWDVRLQTELDSGMSKLDQTFDAATIASYSRDGRVLIPPASPIHGFVASLHASTNETRTGML